MVYDLERLRSALLFDQGTCTGDRYPDEAGAILHVRPGAEIRKGDGIFSVRIERGDWNLRRQAYQSCLRYRGGAPLRQPEIVRE